MTRNNSEAELEAFFEAARTEAPALSDGLRDRIVADALAVAPARAPWWRFAQLREVIGGWYGLGGLVTAGLMGLWIGIAPPVDAMDPLAFLDGATALDIFQQSFDLVEVSDVDA
jgi:hypothetical protein